MPLKPTNPEEVVATIVQTRPIDTVYVKQIIFNLYGHLGQKSEAIISLDEGTEESGSFTVLREKTVRLDGVQMLQFIDAISPDNRFYNLYGFLTGSGHLPSGNIVSGSSS